MYELQIPIELTHLSIACTSILYNSRDEFIEFNGHNSNNKKLGFISVHRLIKILLVCLL